MQFRQNDAFFTSNSKETLKKLLLKGIVQEIDYLHELKSGNIEWTSKKINKFIFEDVEEVFKQKFKSELIWINFIHLNGIETAKRLTRENNSPEDVLKQTLIQHIDSSRFDDAQPIDLNWYKEIIEKAIEYLNNKSRENKLN